MDGTDFTAMIFLILALALYLLPTIAAANNHHRSLGAVFALNLLLGWTFLGCVIALVWALTYQGEPRTR